MLLSLKRKVYLSLLSVVVFAVLYNVLHKAILAYTEKKTTHRWYDYLYFSFVTQTTVGYSDNVILKHPLLKLLAVLQMITIIVIIIC